MIYAASPVRADGGTLFVYVGNPGVGVAWRLTGHGALLGTSDKTDVNGVAFARYNPQGGVPAQPDDQITVAVDVYA